MGTERVRTLGSVRIQDLVWLLTKNPSHLNGGVLHPALVASLNKRDELQVASRVHGT